MIPLSSFRTMTAYFKSPVDCQHAIDDLIHAGLSMADLHINDKGASLNTLDEIQQDTVGTVWDALSEFFRADVKSNLYDKETLGPDSYGVAGSPCHGGYAYESTASETRGPISNDARREVILKITCRVDVLIIDAILEHHNALR